MLLQYVSFKFLQINVDQLQGSKILSPSPTLVCYLGDLCVTFKLHRSSIKVLGSEIDFFSFICVKQKLVLFNAEVWSDHLTSHNLLQIEGQSSLRNWRLPKKQTQQSTSNVFKFKAMVGTYAYSGTTPLIFFRGSTLKVVKRLLSLNKKNSIQNENITY